MGISVQILAERGLVFVEYDGVIRLPETAAAFADYASHPDFRPGQRQLVDLARVTGWDNDFTAMMAMQAKKADTFMGHEREMLMVYHAPTEASKVIASIILRSWEEVPGLVALIQDTEAGALEILGQPETSFADMLQSAS